jgi:hypothetical protein
LLPWDPISKYRHRSCAKEQADLRVMELGEEVKTHSLTNEDKAKGKR